MSPAHAKTASFVLISLGAVALSDATQVDRLHIGWPSSIEQLLRDIPAQQWLVITAGHPTVHKITP